MLISFIKYLMVLTAGLVIGYLIFTEQSDREHIATDLADYEEQSEDYSIESSLEQVDAFETVVGINPDQKNQVDDIESTHYSEAKLIAKLNAQIKSQQLKIAELEDLLKRKNVKTAALQLSNSQDILKEPQAIETLSMQDFENKMKDQFLERFKGFAIELEGERLDSIKKEFNKDSTKSNWNADYENNINAFIQDNDPHRLHYIDELNCNSNMCRLKVNTNQPNNWQQLFLRMTQQAWYHSITLSEKSGDPSIFIYFITKPQNLS